MPRTRPAECNQYGFQSLSWSERRDLNSGPPVPQTGALTGLRYAPTDAEIINLTRISRNKFNIGIFAIVPCSGAPLNSRARECEG